MRSIWLANLAAYSVQVAVLITTALLSAAILRMRAPRPALYFWQAVLVVTIVLPFVPSNAARSPDPLFGSASIIVYGLTTWSLPLGDSGVAAMVIALTVCGAATRLAWLAIGLARLHAIRRRSQPLSPLPVFVGDLATRLGTSADIHTSDDIDSPVTIGLRRPLILLPARALALPLPVQRAIVCHELIHVRRHDWVHIVLEQVWCGLLWFHPAAYLLVSRTSLMREALVDRDTLAVTRDRRSYAHALLAFAEPSARVPIAVPSLIRARHLSRRIALITQETPMSHRHIAAALVVGLATVSVATAASVSRFPIMRAGEPRAYTVSAARPTQDDPVRPGNGVSLPRVVEEVRPEYTAAAMQAKIQGNVELDVVVLANGDPGRIVVSRSLDAVHGLDDAAMQAAAQWKFEPGRRDGRAVPVLITLQMTFTLR